MTAEDWLNVGWTMILIFGLLTGARYLKVMYAGRIPKWSTWTVLLVYNGVIGALLLAGRLGGIALPAVVTPVAVVGGNGALLTFFGAPPGLRRTPKAQRTRSGPVAPDPSREKIVPSAKKRRHKKR